MRLLNLITHETRLQSDAKEELQEATSPRFERILSQDVVAFVLVDAMNIVWLAHSPQYADEHLRDESWVRCVPGLNDVRVCLCYNWQYFLWRLGIKFDE